MEHCIDFVVTWVDSSDPTWFDEFTKYKYGNNVNSECSIDTNTVRYRDWGLLKFWFRGIEQFAPWVRYIHFVTYGHIPSWLDLKNPKLRIVRHEDYIPNKYLPLFNSNPIELMMNNIPDLAEHFVYFNDDFFLIRPITEDYFFHNGKPCDMAVVKNHHSMNGLMLGITKNNMEILNQEFNILTQISKFPLNWFSPRYKGFLKLTLQSLLSGKYVSLLDTHAPISYLKTTFNEVWDKYSVQLGQTMSHRFRSSSDINHWIFRYWQLLKGIVEPRNIYNSTGVFYQVDENIDDIISAISSQKYFVMVINDGENVGDLDKTINDINKAFAQILPDKSSFEK